MTAGAIDWGKLFELVWASALAGVAVAIVYATLIVGVSRASESRRAGRDGAATAYFALATFAALALAGGVAFGISVILSK
jgi:Na+/H+-dicarboxylate symporter